MLKCTNHLSINRCSIAALFTVYLAPAAIASSFMIWSFAETSAVCAHTALLLFSVTLYHIINNVVLFYFFEYYEYIYLFIYFVTNTNFSHLVILTSGYVVIFCCAFRADHHIITISLLWSWWSSPKKIIIYSSAYFTYFTQRTVNAELSEHTS